MGVVCVCVSVCVRVCVFVCVMRVHPVFFRIFTQTRSHSSPDICMENEDMSLFGDKNKDSGSVTAYKVKNEWHADSLSTARNGFMTENIMFV